MPAHSQSRWALALTFAGLLQLAASDCFAQPAQPDIQSQIQSLQAQLDYLKSSYGIPDPPPAYDNACPDCWEAEECDCPAGSAESAFPTARLTGFFQADAGFFRQDPANIVAIGNALIPGDIQNGADFRRARLAAVGDAWDNVSYMLEMDFAFPGRPSFMDVWLDLRDFGSGTLRVGQFRQPIGMDGLTSVKELTFLERALPFAFLPFRQIGMMYYGVRDDELATWAVSGFRYPTDQFGSNIGDAGGFGMAARVTGLLADGPDGIVHIGGGYSFADPANNLVRYLNQPEFSVSETGAAALTPVGVPDTVPPFVNTGAIPAHHFHLLSGELAASYGSFYAQSEVYSATVNQIAGPQLNFSGAYAYAGYFLTGETRPYNKKAGVFGRVNPLEPFGPCGWGAWEIAARWSYINLNSNNIQGGDLTDLTVGLNWYLNKHTKFQFNYIHAFLESSPAVNGPIIYNSNADIFAVRAQVDF